MRLFIKTLFFLLFPFVLFGFTTPYTPYYFGRPISPELYDRNVDWILLIEYRDHFVFFDVQNDLSKNFSSTKEVDIFLKSYNHKGKGFIEFSHLFEERPATEIRTITFNLYELLNKHDFTVLGYRLLRCYGPGPAYKIEELPLNLFDRDFLFEELFSNVFLTATGAGNDKVKYFEKYIYQVHTIDSLFCFQKSPFSPLDDHYQFLNQMNKKWFIPEKYFLEPFDSHRFKPLNQQY